MVALRHFEATYTLAFYVADFGKNCFGGFLRAVIGILTAAFEYILQIYCLDMQLNFRNRDVSDLGVFKYQSFNGFSPFYRFNHRVVGMSLIFKHISLLTPVESFF